MATRFGSRTPGLPRASLVAFLIALLLFPIAGQAGSHRFPEPDPPAVDLGAPARPLAAEDTPRRLAAASEWGYHKTGDNSHPDGNEQQMMWLMNRARANPAQEGVWLATEDDPDVTQARSFFNVDTGVLQTEFAGYAAKPPAAFDVRLYNAAKAHSDYLIGIQGQTHDGQFTRIQAAGFDYTQAAGIVFSYSKHALYGHAAFNIDWGAGTDGTQDPPGHRYAIMSVNGSYTNVGYAVVAAAGIPNFGPQVITGNFCYADPNTADHYNRFLVGTVWTDANGNDRYDPGEGIGGVRVEPDHGSFYAVTADSGGYAFPVTAAGDYDITFSGSSVSSPVTVRVAVGSNSVLLDLEHAGASSSAPEANTGSASSVASTSAVLNGSVDTNGSSSTYYFEYGASTGYGSTTPTRQASAASSVSESVTGLLPETAYHFRLVASNAHGTSFGPDRSLVTLASDPEPGDGGSGSGSGGGGGGGGGCFISASGGRPSRGMTSVIVLAMAGFCLYAVRRAAGTNGC